MIDGLTEHQRSALVRYKTLTEEQPQLFDVRSRRIIVSDSDALVRYATEHQVVLGVAAETPQVLFVVDLVESISSGGELYRYPYLRVISRAQLHGGENVAVLATIENPSLGQLGDIVLIRQERHAIGEEVEEIPRGFGEEGVSGQAQALDELASETGFMGDSATFLGVTAPDSGLTDSRVTFYHVAATRQVDRKPEIGEAIVDVRMVSREQLWRDIRSGKVRDGFTLQALALYEDLLGRHSGGRPDGGSDGSSRG